MGRPEKQDPDCGIGYILIFIPYFRKSECLLLTYQRGSPKTTDRAIEKQFSACKTETYLFDDDPPETVCDKKNWAADLATSAQGGPNDKR